MMWGVVNSCAVTAEAARQSRQSIRRLHRDHPQARIFVTGCAAQLDPDFYAAMPEVTRVLGNREKRDLAMYRTSVAHESGAAKIRVGDIMAPDAAQAPEAETPAALGGSFAGRARAFVQIQSGCDHRCTFCTIPYARGNSCSVPVDTVVRQVQQLVAGGHNEVVLSGVDIAAYGRDFASAGSESGVRLGGLVQVILARVPALPRLRLSTLDCLDIDAALFTAFATEPRLMPHVHLSLQSGDATILKRMARRHSPQQAAALIARFRAARPDMVFGADMIAGFPTESESMFANSVAFVQQNRISWLHVFPYSERPLTPAARIPRARQIPRKERLARARQLRLAGARVRTDTLAARIGARADILVEADNCGKDRYFCPVRLAGADISSGTLLSADIVGMEAGMLQARVAGELLRS